MSIPPLPDVPLVWKNKPSTETPFDAEVLNPWGTQMHALAAAARDYAESAQQSAQEAGQQDDQAVANAIGTTGSQANVVVRGLIGEVVDDAGGVDPNDVGYDVIPLLGQSNMVGRGVPLAADPPQPSDPRVHAFDSTGLHANQITAAVEPLAHWGTITAGSVGLGVAFAREYLRTVSPNRKVLLVPAAQGATSFTGGARRWRVTHAPEHENLYLLALRQIRLAMQAAGPNARLVGFLWHQGEGDSGNATYADDLDALITGLRTELNVPTAWFILGQMSPAGNAISVGKQAVDAVHIDTPRRHERAAFAYAPYGAHLPQDTTHFSAAGLWALGRSYARALPLAKANELGLPPVPPGAVRAVHGTPGALTVEWDRPASRFTDFVVQHRLHGTSDPWVTWPHDPSLHNRAIIGGYALGDLVDVRVATVNEVGTSEPALGEALSPTPWPEGAFPVPPARAYSTRKVRADYTGNCLRVRRSLDNTEAEIGFALDGSLDEAALLTFCGSGNGFVRAWYNQYGGGGLVQPTAAAQPQIVADGTVIKENGRPALVFDGVDDHMHTTVTSLTPTGSTVVMVARVPGDAPSGATFIAEGSSSSDSPMYRFFIDSGDAAHTARGDGGGGASAVSPTDVYLRGATQVMAVTDDRSTVRFISDRRVDDPQPRAMPSPMTVDRFAIGALVRTTTDHHAPMTLHEALIWHQALSPDAVQAGITNLSDHYTLLLP